MSRIRSIHPGQWTDEDFVECSFAARLLALGLRNEADDNGVFEWKPVGLKMRLFPADPVDMGKLFAELTSTNQIKSFEVDGRKYGAIRNFRVYQSPKSPTAVHPAPDIVLVYAGVNRAEGSLARRGPGRPPSHKLIPQNGEINSHDAQGLSAGRGETSLKSLVSEGLEGNGEAETGERCLSEKTDSERAKDQQKQIDSGGEFPLNGEINPNQDNSFPQNGEINSLMERRGKEGKKKNPLTPIEPPPGKALQAAMDAAGMLRQPPDWREFFDRWKDAGADFLQDVLPAIKRVSAEVQANGGKVPYRMKLFDDAVMSKLDADRRQVAQWEANTLHAKHQTQQQTDADAKEVAELDALIAEGKALGRPVDGLIRQRNELAPLARIAGVA
jgi:hypothetical protein